MLRSGHPRDSGSIPDKKNRFIFQNVQTGSENQPTLRYELNYAYSLGGGAARPVREAVHSPHLVPSWRMRGAVPPLTYTFSV